MKVILNNTTSLKNTNATLNNDYYIMTIFFIINPDYDIIIIAVIIKIIVILITVNNYCLYDSNYYFSAGYIFIDYYHNY